jgi:hypothetical protein
MRLTEMAVRRLIGALAPLITIYAVAVPLAAQSARTSSQDVIGPARGAYYSLSKQGFDGFKATIDPNWEVILGPASTAANLKVFRALQFSMTVDANGAATVSHEALNTEKLRVEPYVTQIHNNMQRLVAAFFGTWARFMVSSPFPAAVKIENVANGYRLSYTTQSTDAILTLTSDLLIAEWNFTAQRSKRTIKPLFRKTAEGLLLTGYQTVFEPAGEGIKTTLDYTIEYQDVSGMKLPHRIQIRGMYGSEPVEAELIFNQYALNPRRTN